MSDLILPLKGIYFDQIAARTKLTEYRLATPYWDKRLVGREYTRIVLTKGYPRSSDYERHLYRRFNGWKKEVINHPHFGPDDVLVYAIDVSETAA